MEDGEFWLISLHQLEHAQLSQGMETLDAMAHVSGAGVPQEWIHG